MQDPRSLDTFYIVSYRHTVIVWPSKSHLLCLLACHVIYLSISPLDFVSLLPLIICVNCIALMDRLSLSVDGYILCISLSVDGYILCLSLSVDGLIFGLSLSVEGYIFSLSLSVDGYIFGLSLSVDG